MRTSLSRTKVQAATFPKSGFASMQGQTSLIGRLRTAAARLRLDAVTLWVAARDRRTPWAARLVAYATAAYAFSPIDLIPDFIPILGLLDDLVLLPLGLWIALRLIPQSLLDDYRATARRIQERPTAKGAAIFVIAIWLACAALAGLFFL